MTDLPGRAVYLDAVAAQAPRLLGLINRNSASATYGCFDRSYWHYRVVDTPSARCQEAVLTLALLHRLSESPYRGKNALLAWARAGMDFWRSQQRPDGSFDEWYPNEHSFVATAFSAYAVAEARLLCDRAAGGGEAAIDAGLARAGRWLLKTGEARALNQFAGSTAALYNIFLVTGEREFERGARERLGVLGRRQSREGWFPEYGGADIGYLSLAIAYLGQLYRKAGWPEALDIASASMEFIKMFLHRDGTAGGEYSSRLTEYLIPDGFEILARESGTARTISRFVRDSLRTGRGVSLPAFDDRYLTYVGYNFLEAYRHAVADVPAEEPVVSPGRRGVFTLFNEAGLAVIRDETFEGVVNLHRGGAFKFVFKNGATLSDAGLIAVTPRRGPLYAGFWDEAVDQRVEDRRVTVRGRLRQVEERPLAPWSNIVFRAFQLTVGRLAGVGLKLKDLLRNVIIMPRARRGVEYERIIEVDSDRISVADRVRWAGRQADVQTIVLGVRNSFPYTPSSKFFNTADLDDRPLVLSPPAADCRHGCIEVSRRYSLDGELCETAMRAG